MLTFGEIKEKTVRVAYTDEIDGYKVDGTATYNKEQKLTRATGTILMGEELVANFNTSGTKVNILDCNTDMMSVVASMADAVIKALDGVYPQE